MDRKMYNYRRTSFNLRHSDVAKLFASLSLMVGGNSQEITRGQLKIYIRQAENGYVFPTVDLLNSYKRLDKSWNLIFGENVDKISVKEFYKASSIFSNSIVNDKFEKDSNDTNYNSDESTVKYLKELSERINGKDDVLASTKQIKNYLLKLIDDNTDDNDNGEEIAKITNVLATINTSNVEFDV